MKKVLTVLAIIALTGSIAVNAAESKLENLVNKTIAPVTDKEKELNAKMEAQQKANEAKQADLKKQQQEAKDKHQATKDAVKAEKDYLNSTTKKK